MDPLEWARAHPLSPPDEIPQEVLDRLEAASVTPQDDEDAADVLCEWGEAYVAASGPDADPDDVDHVIRAVRAIGRSLHIESLRRRGVVELERAGPDPYAENAMLTVPRSGNDAPPQSRSS